MKVIFFLSFLMTLFFGNILLEENKKIYSDKVESFDATYSSNNKNVENKDTEEIINVIASDKNYYCSEINFLEDDKYLIYMFISNLLIIAIIIITF